MRNATWTWCSALFGEQDAVHCLGNMNMNLLQCIVWEGPRGDMRCVVCKVTDLTGMYGGFNPRYTYTWSRHQPTLLSALLRVIDHPRLNHSHANAAWFVGLFRKGQLEGGGWKYFLHVYCVQSWWRSCRLVQPQSKTESTKLFFPPLLEYRRWPFKTS